MNRMEASGESLTWQHPEKGKQTYAGPAGLSL